MWQLEAPEFQKKFQKLASLKIAKARQPGFIVVRTFQVELVKALQNDLILEKEYRKSEE